MSATDASRPYAAQLATTVTLYDAVDALFGTRLGETLDELLIKGLMDFFDEGQSVWSMPGRRQGLYRAWSRIARRNRRLRLRGLDVGALLAEADGPEAMIDRVMTRLGIPESLWMEAFGLELTRLHGWAGFVRWRAQARDYYWQQRNPADLIDYVAIRLVLALALLQDAAARLKRPLDYPALHDFAAHNPGECLLRRELHAGLVLPDYAHRVDLALDRGDPADIAALAASYERERIAREAATRAERVMAICEAAGIGCQQLLAQDDATLTRLVEGIYTFKAREGFVWTQALERSYARRLLRDMTLPAGASSGTATGGPSVAGAPPAALDPTAAAGEGHPRSGAPDGAAAAGDAGRQPGMAAVVSSLRADAAASTPAAAMAGADGAAPEDLGGVPGAGVAAAAGGAAASPGLTNTPAAEGPAPAEHPAPSASTAPATPMAAGELTAAARAALLASLPPPPPVRRRAAPDRSKGGAGPQHRTQALFCIDVRSERLRRHLEAIGDYDTYGIAGFFGIPVAFIELGKGHETNLCPAIVTPNNVALEMPHTHGGQHHSLFDVAHEVVHDLKATVLAPYITVEAVGLLFGFDMIGKTFAPRPYARWRKTLESHKRPARILIDKITEDEAVELVANLQDEMVMRAIERQFGIKREALTGPMIGELRLAALGEQQGLTAFARQFELDSADEQAFLQRLRDDYGVNPGQEQIQLEHLAKIGFRASRQALLVGTALRSIGLTGDFGRTVLVVGHGSTSENNPYESALDCGACGGDQGLVNARVFAAMANRREVRRLLLEQGIEIPDETWFIPALHDTTTDALQLYDLEQLPPGALTRLTRIQEDLDAAGRLCALERCQALDERAIDSSEAATRRAYRNASDWTQVRPEWGLSNNASFIIGRRDLTRGVDLAGRAFMHSYDHRVDPEGRLLENILAGPLVVAQWINMEHYFSVVDNEAFGSGSKVYHNVTGRFGVISGNLSDLRTGLPAQTMSRATGPYHQPMRLITVIEAPQARVEAVLARVFKPRQLVENGWVRLIIVDPDTGERCWYEAGAFRPVH